VKISGGRNNDLSIIYFSSMAYKDFTLENSTAKTPILTSFFTSSQIFSSVSIRQKLDFCTQLSFMLGAKISIQRALEIFIHQCQHPGMKNIASDILAEVKRGNPFYKGLAKHPKTFDSLFITTAEVGEESGKLSEVLADLAKYLERVVEFQKKIQQALMYPALVILVAISAILFLLLFIVPSFEEMFKNFQVQPPLITQIIVALSNFLTENIFTIIILGIVSVLTLVWFGGNDTVKKKAQSLSFSLPYIKKILLLITVARFCRTLGTLLQAQVSLMDSLKITERIFTNEKVKSEIQSITKKIRLGKNISSSVVSSSLFPPMVSQMIAVGEETSDLDKMLLHVAEYYEKEMERIVDTISTLLEPIIILILGVFVGGILIAMYLPMFEIMNVVN